MAFSVAAYGATVSVSTAPNGATHDGEAPSLYSHLDQQLNATWPLLTDHPSTNDVPEHGMTYRLDGNPITWWVVRRGDLIATQLSAHDIDGSKIARSRDLKTGIETTVNLDEVNNRTAPTGTLEVIRQGLRTSKTNIAFRIDQISTNISDQQAIIVSATSSTAQVRSAVIDVRRELIDNSQADKQMAQELQFLRKMVMKLLREEEQ